MIFQIIPILLVPLQIIFNNVLEEVLSWVFGKQTLPPKNLKTSVQSWNHADERETCQQLLEWWRICIRDPAPNVPEHPVCAGKYNLEAGKNEPTINSLGLLIGVLPRRIWRSYRLLKKWLSYLVFGNVLEETPLNEGYIQVQ